MIYPTPIKLFFQKIKRVHLRYFILFFTSLLFISLDKTSTQSFKKIELSGVAQGTTWHITYYAEDTLITKNQVDSILSVIDSSLSIYKPYSHIVAFNNSKTGIV